MGYKFPIGQRRWMIICFRNSWLYSIKCLDGHSGGYLQVKSNLSLEKFTILRTRSLATTWTRKVECYSSEPAVNYVTQCRIDRTKLPNFSTHLYRPWHKIFFCHIPGFLMVSSYQERIGTGYESSCFCMAWWWSPDLRMTLQHGFARTHRFFDVVLIWTIEPDISVVKATAQFHLPLGILHTTYLFYASFFQ